MIRTDNYTPPHKHQTNHYYRDSDYTGKRQPCPNCQSKTGLGKYKCFKCGYTLRSDKAPNVAPLAPIQAPLCDCGNELNTPQQRKSNKCFFCQVNLAYNKADSNPKLLGRFSYAYRKGLPGAILAGLGAKIIRLSGHDVLCYPLTSGELRGYQTIYHTGEKFYAFPKHEGGFFHAILGQVADGMIECEGLATAISLKLAVPGANIVIAGNADGLIKGARLYGAKIAVIAADNDQNQTGLIKANQAAEIHGAKVWLCPIISDFNDLHCQQGLEAVCASYHAFLNYQDTPLSRLAQKYGLTYQQVNMQTLAELEMPIEGMCILASKMGTGKTKYALRQVRESADSCLSIAHLRSLVNGMATGLRSENYQNTPLAPDYLACCINSISKYERVYDAILIDEFDAALDMVACGATMTDNERIKCHASLTRMIETSRLTVFTSATFLTEHIETALEMAKGKPITIIENVWQPTKQIVLQNLSDFIYNRDQAIKNNRNIFGFIDSKDKVIALENELKEKGISAISIHSGNSKDNIGSVLGDYRNYHVTIGSPSVLAGVSYEPKRYSEVKKDYWEYGYWIDDIAHEVNYFDDVFIQLDGKADLSPLSSCQSLGRVRAIDKLYVCIGDNKENLSAHEQSCEDLLREKRQSMASELRKVYENAGASEEFINAKINEFINLPFSDYDKVSVRLQKAQKDLSANWQENFIRFANDLGYRTIDQRDRRALLADIATARAISVQTQAVKQARYEEISTINLDQYDIGTLRYSAERTEKETYAVIKADCQRYFEDTTTETIKEVMSNDLHGKAFNYALARCEAFADKKLTDEVARIIASEKSTANAKNMRAKFALIAALLRIANVTIDQNGQYDFHDTNWLTEKTDYSEIDQLISQHKSTLGLSRFTVEGHKTTLRLLRQWLGFELEMKRIKGAGYKWSVVGMLDNLIAVGGNNKLMELQETVSQNGAIDDQVPLCVNHESLIETQSSTNEVKCLHGEWDIFGGTPTCLDCEATWASVEGFMTDFVELHAGTF